MNYYPTVTLAPVSAAFGAENEDRTVVEGYMCRTDFQCEAGMVHTTVYPSLESVPSTCRSHCGVVRVAMVCVEIVSEPEE